MIACCCSLPPTACRTCQNNPLRGTMPFYDPLRGTMPFYDPLRGTMPFYDPEPSKSWACHKCGAVYAPTTPQCFRCTGEKK